MYAQIFTDILPLACCERSSVCICENLCNNLYKICDQTLAPASTPSSFLIRNRISQFTAIFVEL
jgi:hypothetical protein